MGHDAPGPAVPGGLVVARTQTFGEVGRKLISCLLGGGTRTVRGIKGTARPRHIADLDKSNEIDCARP